MSIYDLEFLEHQKFIYKEQGENLVKKDEVYNAWTFNKKGKKYFISNSILQCDIQYRINMSDKKLQKHIKDEMYRKIPSCFRDSIFSSQAINVGVNKFLKFIGISFKFIWTSLKRKVLDRFEELFNKDILKLQLWTVTSMIQFINQEHQIYLNDLSLKEKAIYLSVYKVTSKDYVREYYFLLRNNINVKKYSKTRLFKRVGSLRLSWYLETMMRMEKLGLLTEVLDLLLSLTEKEFEAQRADYAYFYYAITLAKFSCGEYFFYDDLTVMNKKHREEMFTNNSSSQQINWGSRHHKLPLYSYEEEKENFLHLVLLYKDAGCDLDGCILDNFPVIKALINTLGEEEAIIFLNKQKKETEVPF